MSAFYITTAIEYANGEPHLGHAFEKIGADAIARYRSLCGDVARLLVGTDDHGLKVARAAQTAGITPREQADHISHQFRRAWDTLGIRYARFVRTTADQHAAGVDALIARIVDRNPAAFYEREYEGWYCVGCEAFRTERELEAGCCPIHPTVDIERVAESNWFFRLSAYRDVLLEHLRAHPGFVEPVARYNEILAFVERGLDDVSITRASLDWGIPFPIPDRIGRHQVIYVWFDALPSYLTATGFPAGPTDIRWPADVHVVGKDITRFHCVLWPAMLHAAGLPLPGRVWAHGFLRANGARLSKTAGVWIDLDEAIARHGADALRYFLLREVAFDSDGDFSYDRFDARYSADLANTLGNLTSRVTALIVRSRGGQVPGPGRAGCVSVAVSDAVRRLTERDDDGVRRYRRAFDGFLPHDALAAVWDTLAAGNEFVTRVAPWRLAREADGAASLDEALWALTRLLARQAVLLAPVLPAKAQELWGTLGGPGLVHDVTLDSLARLDPAGFIVTPGVVLFPRWV